MPKPVRKNPSGIRIEISQIVPQSDLEVTAEPDLAAPKAAKDETERLTRARRQHAEKVNAPATTATAAAPPAAKAGFWSRLLGLTPKPRQEP